MQRVGAVLWPHFPCLQVYGANTNVGKTIVSTLLCHAWSKKRKTFYLKPVSTGALEEADNRYELQFRSCPWIRFSDMAGSSGCEAFSHYGVLILDAFHILTLLSKVIFRDS